MTSWEGLRVPRKASSGAALESLQFLAVPAPEVAAYGPDRVCRGPWVIVIKRLLFYVRHIFVCNSSVDQGKKRPFTVFPYSANAPFTGPDPASVSTEVALHLIFGELFIKHCFVNHLQISFLRNSLFRDMRLLKKAGQCSPVFICFLQGNKPVVS